MSVTRLRLPVREFIRALRIWRAVLTLLAYLWWDARPWTYPGGCSPERVKREWDLFQEEVQAEAERLERGGRDHGPQDTSVPASEQPPEPTLSPQEQIDRLRARVADLSTRLEGHR